MVVALAFPPSAVDGSNSKLRCGPARSWLSQGLSSSFMTCGEVYCKGGFCMRLGTQTTALLYWSFSLKTQAYLNCIVLVVFYLGR